MWGGFCPSGPFFVKVRRQFSQEIYCPLRAGLAGSFRHVLAVGRKSRSLGRRGDLGMTTGDACGVGVEEPAPLEPKGAAPKYQTHPFRNAILAKRPPHPQFARDSVT